MGSISNIVLHLAISLAQVQIAKRSFVHQRSHFFRRFMIYAGRFVQMSGKNLKTSGIGVISLEI